MASRLTLSLAKVKYKINRLAKEAITKVIFTLSMLLFVVAVCSNVAHRVPIVSWFGEKIAFPQKYELVGTVRISGEDEPVQIPIEVSVGGFSVRTLNDEEFNLKFVSNRSKKIPVIITYGEGIDEHSEIRTISFEADYTMKKVFEISLGE